MLKPIRPDSSTSCVSPFDSAIDWDASFPGLSVEDAVQSFHIELFVEPSRWRDILKFKEGAQPTVFELGVVPSAELARIEDECRLNRKDGQRQNEAYWRCFLAGCRGIQNLGGEAPKKRSSVDGVERIDPEWLASTFVGHLRQAAISVGSVIYRWNQLDPDTVKN